MSENKQNGEMSRSVKITNRLGIHARPASLLVKTASRYDADVAIEKNGNRVSAKSMMGLLTLEASHGSDLLLLASGNDAEQVLDELEALFLSGFDED